MSRSKQKLKIAVSQFPVSESIQKNLKCIEKHILKAAKQSVDIIHFPELALSGYNTKIEEIEWEVVQNAIDLLKILAKKNNIFIVIGVHVRNPNEIRPYNSTIIISDKGKLVGTYIKSKLYGAENDRFSKKDNQLVIEIKGVRCGFLICYESGFPNLFESYSEQGVKLLFLSYYNAGSTKPKNSMDELMRSQFVTRSTDNLMYISGSNSSSKYSRMPSSFVSPDGKVTSAKRHKSEIIIVKYPSPNLGWTQIPIE